MFFQGFKEDVFFLLVNFQKSHCIAICRGEQKFSWVCGTVIEFPAFLRFCSKWLGLHAMYFQSRTSANSNSRTSFRPETMDSIIRTEGNHQFLDNSSVRIVGSINLWTISWHISTSWYIMKVLCPPGFSRNENLTPPPKPSAWTWLATQARPDLS